MMNPELRSYKEAMKIILGCAMVKPVKTVALNEALNAVLAEDACARVAAPRFDNSAMDGFTLRAEDTAAATADAPIRLKITNSLPAGDDVSPPSLQPHTVVEIMTGAATPSGATTVVPVENAVIEDGYMLFTSPAEDDRHIRRSGEDFEEGQVILPAGHIVSVNSIPALTAAGISELIVRPTPNVAWVSTGRELVDDFSQELGPNQIYNSTGLYGRAALESIGANVGHQATVSDDGESFRIAMKDILSKDIDVIISTGAVSVGKYDFVRTELEAMGAEILLHKARVRPGKPILFAQLPCGTYFFGLPGNPVSSAMGLRVFVMPFLRALSAMTDEKTMKAVLSQNVSSAGKLTVFLKAHYYIDDDAIVKVKALRGQQSFKVAPMVSQNCWLLHPEGTDALKAGDVVEFLPFFPIEPQHIDEINAEGGMTSSCC